MMEALEASSPRAGRDVVLFLQALGILGRQAGEDQRAERDREPSLLPFATLPCVGIGQEI
jgi:hypothetical protein